MRPYALIRRLVMLSMVCSMLGCVVGIEGKSIVIDNPPQDKSAKRPGVDEIIMAQTDVWGDLSMQEENGPSYEFFKDLLPPLRYVNAPFREYPIVLCAPRNLVKARFVSNGSGVNLMAFGAPGWQETGFPVTLRVGPREALFGANPRLLDGPRYADGYLPIVQLRYKDLGCVYGQETFASTDPKFADHGAVFVRFTLPEGEKGDLTAHVNFKAPMQIVGDTICDASGQVLVWHDGSWTWDPAWKFLKTPISKDKPAASLVVFTKPYPSPLGTALTQEFVNDQRQICVNTWESIIADGMKVETPETVVNNAWKSLIVGIFMLVRDDLMCYSAHNQYQQIYITEGGDAIKTLMAWGYDEEARRLMPPIMDYLRKGLEHHQAGLKLQMLSYYYWLTRDAKYVEEQRARWERESNRIMDVRDSETGLVPKGRYCGDIATQVHALGANSNAWRGLRDCGAMIAELGESEKSQRMAVSANELRAQIFSAVEKSEDLTTRPPFIPQALFGVEKPYEVLTADKLGSYWDIVIPFVLGTEVFGPKSDRERWVIEYLQQHGGICMGMLRVRSTSEYWVNKSNLDDLYGGRYTLALLKLDDVDRALVSFYGKLAQGMTRDTFIDGEATCLVPVDDFGRQVSLPPNSAANAFFLQMLRYLLVQDWDMNDDGVPDELRLCFATPRRWLLDGKRISVEDAPSDFGEVSVTMESHISNGEVVANVTLPTRKRNSTLLRARVPDGFTVVSAEVAGAPLAVDGKGTVDLTQFEGNVKVVFKVKH